MAFRYADRVKELCAGTGSGPLTLLGAPVGFTSVASRLSVGDTTHVCVLGKSSGEWEVVLATLTGNATLALGSLVESSTGSRIAWTGEEKEVFICLPSQEVIRRTEIEAAIAAEAGARDDADLALAEAFEAALALKADAGAMASALAGKADAAATAAALAGKADADELRQFTVYFSGGNAEIVPIPMIAGVSIVIPAGTYTTALRATAAATGVTAYALKKNGASIGTATVSATGTTASFVVSGDTTITGGTDTFDGAGPATEDNTLRGVALSVPFRFA